MTTIPSQPPWRATKNVLTGFAALYGIGFLVALFVPSSVYWLGLLGERMDDPRYYYTLLTYPLIHGGLGHLALTGVLTLVPVRILAHRVRTRPLLTVVGAAGVLGGIAFCLSSSSELLIGGGLIAWGLAGAVVGAMTYSWESFGRWEIGYGVLAAAVLGGTLLLGPSAADMGILVAAAVGVAGGRWMRLERGQLSTEAGEDLPG